MEAIELVVAALWIAGVFVVAIGGAAMKLLYRRLRLRHYQAWLELGEPSLFFNASMYSNKRIAQFLWGRQEKELGDETIGRIASASRALAVLGTALILVAVGLFIALLWFNSA